MVGQMKTPFRTTQIHFGSRCEPSQAKNRVLCAMVWMSSHKSGLRMSHFGRNLHHFMFGQFLRQCEANTCGIPRKGSFGKRIDCVDGECPRHALQGSREKAEELGPVGAVRPVCATCLHLLQRLPSLLLYFDRWVRASQCQTIHPSSRACLRLHRTGQSPPPFLPLLSPLARTFSSLAPLSTEYVPFSSFFACTSRSSMVAGIREMHVSDAFIPTYF